MNEQTPQLNQEKIYDDKIFPLMQKIMEICEEHKIPMIASFVIPNQYDPHLVCTSLLTGPSYIGDDEHLQKAAHAVGAL